MQFNTEAQFQAYLTQKHHNLFPDERGRLFMIHNNAKSGKEGAEMMALGRRRGPSDLCYLPEGGVTTWIELKLPGQVQTDDQKVFEKRTRECNDDYFVCDNEEYFFEILEFARRKGKILQSRKNA